MRRENIMAPATSLAPEPHKQNVTGIEAGDVLRVAGFPAARLLVAHTRGELLYLVSVDQVQAQDGADVSALVLPDHEFHVARCGHGLFAPTEVVVSSAKVVGAVAPADLAEVRRVLGLLARGRSLGKFDPSVNARVSRLIEALRLEWGI